MVAGRWREALAEAAATTVVANADDPLVVWGAGAGPRGGLGGRPACGGGPTPSGCPAAGAGSRSSPSSCGRATAASLAPTPTSGVEEPPRAARRPSSPTAARLPVGPRPSRAVQPRQRGDGRGGGRRRSASPAETALAAMAAVEEVAGRFTSAVIGGVADPTAAGQEPGRLGRAARPGRARDRPRWWSAINARVADGRDPSWLWDVPFERLAGRPVVADRGALPRPVGAARTTPRSPTDGAPTRSRRWRVRRPAIGRRRPGRVHRQLHRLPRPAPSAARRGEPLTSLTHRGRLPRPARHLRRRRQRAVVLAAGRPGGASRPSWSRPRPTRPCPTADIYMPGRGRGRPAGPGGRSAGGGRHAGAGGRPAGRWCWRCAPATRSSGRRFPTPTAGRDRGPRPARRGDGQGRRAAAPSARSWPTADARCPASAPLTGFENHGGRHHRRRRARAPSARVRAGVGNGERHRGGVVGPGGRHLSARAGAGPQPGAGRPAARLGDSATRSARSTTAGAGPAGRAARRRPAAAGPCGGDAELGGGSVRARRVRGSGAPRAGRDRVGRSSAGQPDVRPRSIGADAPGRAERPGPPPRRRPRVRGARGSVPAAARRRAVHQSVRHLVGQHGHRPLDAGPEAAGVLALVGRERRAEDHGDRGPPQPPALGSRCPSRPGPPGASAARLGRTWRVPCR